jgi:magnesium transporter
VISNQSANATQPLAEFEVLEVPVRKRPHNWSPAAQLDDGRSLAVAGAPAMTAASDSVKQPLLQRAYPSHAASASSPSLPSAPYPGPASRRFPGGLDVPNLKKRGGGTRSWICVEAATASVQTLEIDKATMMRRCDLPARDLRLLDPLFVYPSTILGRERAIVVNLEQIRCVITADEVLLLNSLDSYVLQYAAELQRRLLQRAEGDELPFEFRALELALEAACSFLDAQVTMKTP